MGANSWNVYTWKNSHCWKFTYNLSFWAYKSVVRLVNFSSCLNNTSQEPFTWSQLTINNPSPGGLLPNGL